MKNKDLKKEEATIRQEEYKKLTIKEKLNKLDNKLGFNVGAKKERFKLKKQLLKK